MGGVDRDVPLNAQDGWPSSSVTASLATYLRFWNAIPQGSTHCPTFRDFWQALNTFERRRKKVE
jgi:hypothetical protein